MLQNQFKPCNDNNDNCFMLSSLYNDDYNIYQILCLFMIYLLIYLSIFSYNKLLFIAFSKGIRGEVNGVKSKL